jgi:peptide methionine sulfoxide reductase msrA/msrB
MRDFNFDKTSRRKKVTLIVLVTLFSSLLYFQTEDAISEGFMDKKVKDYKIATFAGGCFWCLEPVFDAVKGVESTIVGYSGGDEDSANYQEVSSGKTKHVEAIQVTYDPDEVSFKELLKVYIKNIDPLDPLGQFADKGPQYLTAVFYNTLEEKELIETYFKKVKDEMILKGEIQTKIEPYESFFPAEEYHQEYYKKNPIRYKAYKYGSGRPNRLYEIWGEK